MKKLFDFVKYKFVLLICKFIKFDNPFFTIYSNNRLSAILFIPRDLSPMWKLLRKLKYKMLMLIDHLLMTDNQYCYLKTIKGRILLVEHDINCLYILNDDLDLIRCFLPQMLKPFLKSTHFLITITGYFTKDKTGNILLVHKGCNYFLDSNRPSIVDSDIIVGTF